MGFSIVEQDSGFTITGDGTVTLTMSADLRYAATIQCTITDTSNDKSVVLENKISYQPYVYRFEYNGFGTISHMCTAETKSTPRWYRTRVGPGSDSEPEESMETAPEFGITYKLEEHVGPTDVTINKDTGELTFDTDVPTDRECTYYLLVNAVASDILLYSERLVFRNIVQPEPVLLASPSLIECQPHVIHIRTHTHTLHSQGSTWDYEYFDGYTPVGHCDWIHISKYDGTLRIYPENQHVGRTHKLEIKHQVHCNHGLTLPENLNDVPAACPPVVSTLSFKVRPTLDGNPLGVPKGSRFQYQLDNTAIPITWPSWMQYDESTHLLSGTVTNDPGEQVRIEFEPGEQVRIEFEYITIDIHTFVCSYIRIIQCRWFHDRLGYHVVPGSDGTVDTMKQYRSTGKYISYKKRDDNGSLLAGATGPYRCCNVHDPRSGVEKTLWSRYNRSRAPVSELDYCSCRLYIHCVSLIGLGGWE